VNDGCEGFKLKSIAIIQSAINHRASYGLGGVFRDVISNVTQRSKMDVGLLADNVDLLIERPRIINYYSHTPNAMRSC